jgi:hypothetical protein
MSISLVSKLRALADAHLNDGPTFVGETCRDAANRIEALQKALKEIAGEPPDFSGGMFTFVEEAPLGAVEAMYLAREALEGSDT